MVTQKMPRLYVRKTIRDLIVGEEGWIPRDAVWVNFQDEVFLCGSQQVATERKNSTDIKVICEEAGLVLDFRQVQAVAVWDRANIIENKMADALPVAQLRFNDTKGVPQ